MKHQRRRGPNGTSFDPQAPAIPAIRLESTAPLRIWLLLCCAIVTVVWTIVLLGQPLAGDSARWMLFLVPDQMIATWWDGPVDMRGLFDRIAVAIVSGVVMASAALAGRQLLRATGLSRSLRSSPYWALATIMGLAIQATVIVGVGLAGGLRHPAAGLLIICVTVFLGHLLGLIFSPTASTEQSASDIEPSAIQYLPTAIAIGIAVLIVSKAILPPAEYDVREYHLQAPKEWWLDGQIEFMPHNIYANMPMAAESHNLLATMIWSGFGKQPDQDAWWWGALSGKLIIAGYAILMAILVGESIRMLLVRTGSAFATSSAKWGTVFALAFPAIIEGSSLGLIESAVGAYLAAGMLVAVTAPLIGSSVLNMTGLISLAASGAIACKYPAVVLVLPALLGCWYWSLNSSELRPIWNLPLILKLISISGLMLIFGGGIWYAKNFYLAGNPVYPLAGNWFGGATLTAEKINQWNSGHSVPGYSLSSLAMAFADLTWRWRLQGWCVVPFAFAGVFVFRNRQLWWLLGLGAYSLIVWWLFTHRIDRFMIPALPILFVIAGLGWNAMRSVINSRLLTTLTLGLLSLNIVYVSGPAIGDARILVSLRYLRIDDLSQSSYSRLPMHVRWINANLSAENRLLIVGDAAVFDYEIPYDYSTTFDRSPLQDLVSGPTFDWPAKFAASGYDYVLVHWGEIERLRSTYGFTDEITPELFGTLVEQGILVPIPIEDSKGRFEVFRLKN